MQDGDIFGGGDWRERLQHVVQTMRGAPAVSSSAFTAPNTLQDDLTLVVGRVT